MSDDAEKYAALRAELEQPGPYSHIYDNTDVLEPEPAGSTWQDAYAGERIFSTTYKSLAEIPDDATFTAHSDENGKHLGYIVERRAE